MLVVILGIVFISIDFIRFSHNKLQIVFCNVGQGDAIFIRFPNHYDVLIDGGPDQKVLACLSRHMPFWDRTIDLVALTHPHEDHLRGILYVLERYTVKSFVTEDVSNTTGSFKELKRHVSTEKITTHLVTQEDTFKIPGGGEIEVMGPSKEFLERTSPEDVINESEGFGNLILLLRYKNFSALFTGDSQTEGLEDAVRRRAILPVDILQIPHHGSKTGINQTLISELAPRLAVISVGKNRYGHPSRQIINLLDKNKIPYKRIDRDGEVEIFTEGSTVWISK